MHARTATSANGLRNSSSSYWVLKIIDEGLSGSVADNYESLRHASLEKSFIFSFFVPTSRIRALGAQQGRRCVFKPSVVFGVSLDELFNLVNRYFYTKLVKLLKI